MTLSYYKALSLKENVNSEVVYTKIEVILKSLGIKEHKFYIEVHS